jgi:hypothetical protein
MSNKKAIPSDDNPIAMEEIDEANELLGGIVEVRWRNPIKAIGYAQIEHIITFDQEISAAAYRLYAAYLFYAHRGEKCWPSSATIGKLLGATHYTVTKLNEELEKAGYIIRQRRVNKTSITWMEDIDCIPRLKELAKNLLEARNSSSSTDVSVDRQLTVDSSPSTDSYRATEEESIKEEEDIPEKNIAGSSTLNQPTSTAWLPASLTIHTEGALNLPGQTNGQPTRKSGTRKQIKDDYANGGKPKKVTDPRKQLLAKALAVVCELDFGTNAAHLNVEAESLLRATTVEPTPELVLEKFSLGSWWYNPASNTYYGSKLHKPPLMYQVRLFWGKWLTDRPADMTHAKAPGADLPKEPNWEAYK